MFFNFHEMKKKNTIEKTAWAHFPYFKCSTLQLTLLACLYLCLLVICHFHTNKEPTYMDDFNLGMGATKMP